MNILCKYTLQFAISIKGSELLEPYSKDKAILLLN